MRPLRLIMQAFGSYGEMTTIDFEVLNQNLFLVTGDTGSGKTTIFDAIVFALYGEASSNANKKEGQVLQSHYADAEPFVELTFLSGGQEYTVKRSPRYQRAKRGGGTTMVNSSVALHMPDGTEYPQKEADRRLEEIVGLTKEQFMQVAMIAQGEFMDMLRAKSNDKKEIFRHLFGTEMYQQIVEKLYDRRREKDRQLAEIRTICQNEVSRLQTEDERILALVERVNKGDLSVLEELVEALKADCEAKESEQKQAEEAVATASFDRDQAKAALVQAEHLMQSYHQLAAAEEELKSCEVLQDAMRKKTVLSRSIRAAYTVQADFTRLQDVRQHVLTMEKELAEQREKLPLAMSAEEELTGQEASAKEKADAEAAVYSITSEKVEKALDLFDRIEKARQELAAAEKAQSIAVFAEQESSQRLQKAEERLVSLRGEQESLSNAQTEYALWEAESKEVRQLREEVEQVHRVEKDIESQKKVCEQADIHYQQASYVYQAARDRYEHTRKAYLDAQAGILAKGLVEGEPCPVCGSTHHPAPCVLEEADVSEDAMKVQEAEADQQRVLQEQTAAAAHAAKNVLKEKRVRYQETAQTLADKLSSTIGGIDAAIAARTAEVRDREQRVKANANRYAEVTNQIGETEKQIDAGRQAAEKARQIVADANQNLAAAQATLTGLQAGQEFASAEEARKVLAEASVKKTETDAVYQRTARALSDAHANRTRIESLLARYEKELPDAKLTQQEREDTYQNQLVQQGMEEEEWQRIADEHPQNQADSLQKEVETFSNRKAAAERAEALAKEQIGEQSRPDMESLQQVVSNAEQVFKSANAQLDQIKHTFLTNHAAYQSLSSNLDTRKTIITEHARLDALYKMASGNVSGARMDLETYVQRYYLERILGAANRRFLEMSGGQFELRMVELARAGEGKNRGLDLMVYSTVTGKEREIRTLSGGESFMAALSLALGMADQIQESSAAIELDMMFIDEGFGSLDDRSRDQAVRVLKDMAEGSRLIGIISHVTELKQEMDNQLVVTKDETGSHVRWEIS